MGFAQNKRILDIHSTLLFHCSSSPDSLGPSPPWKDLRRRQHLSFFVCPTVQLSGLGIATATFFHWNLISCNDFAGRHLRNSFHFALLPIWYNINHCEPNRNHLLIIIIILARPSPTLVKQNIYPINAESVGSGAVNEDNYVISKLELAVIYQR